jgi:tRNA(Ile2) C34 agmatinyltransferase TiaS
MKCPKCKKSMKTDIKSSRYICECGYEILWSGDFIVTEERRTFSPRIYA